MTDASRRGPELLSSLQARAGQLLHEVAKFGVVGVVALVVDVGLFNLLRFAGGEGPMYDKPLSAQYFSWEAIEMAQVYVAKDHYLGREAKNLASISILRNQ